MPVCDVSKPVDVVYLANSMGEPTGYGTLSVEPSDYDLVRFDGGPGPLLQYLAEVDGQKVLLANLEVAHQDAFWSGEDGAFLTVEEARKYCDGVTAFMSGRLPDGGFLVPLDEGMPGRFVVGLAIPLEQLGGREAGQRAVAKCFGHHAADSTF